MTFSAPSAAPTLARPGRVGDRARRHDRSLTAHQAGHGGCCAEHAGVRERDVRAREVVARERVRAGPLHEALVGIQEGRERQARRVADDRHHQGPATVRLLHVHRQAQIHLAVPDAVRLALDLRVVNGHHVQLRRGAGDRIRDQVGEGDLAGGGIAQLPTAPLSAVTVRVRKLVAVGTDRDSSMWCASAAASRAAAQARAAPCLAPRRRAAGRPP